METITNVLVGYAGAIATQFAVFPLFGINTATSTHLAIGLCFTATSLVRSYAIRRLFNRWEVQ
jgi:hypothetical protein